MADTVIISGSVDMQNGEDSVATSLIFTLSHRDYDGSIIEPFRQVVMLDATGSFSGVPLWPNARGVRGTTYSVSYEPLRGRGAAPISDSLYIPDTAGPLDLTDLLIASDAAAALGVPHVAIITQAEYDAGVAAGSLADGVYLVEVIE